MGVEVCENHFVIEKLRGSFCVSGVSEIVAERNEDHVRAIQNGFFAPLTGGKRRAKRGGRRGGGGQLMTILQVADFVFLSFRVFRVLEFEDRNAFWGSRA